MWANLSIPAKFLRVLIRVHMIRMDYVLARVDSVWLAVGKGVEERLVRDKRGAEDESVDVLD